MSIDENEKIVRDICKLVEQSVVDNSNIKPFEQIVYDIDYMLLETNSGASFEQYFRWASIEELSRILPALRSVGLNDIAEITGSAIKIAFPNGIPKDDEEKAELTDWTEDQETVLSSLFCQLEDANARIVDSLAEYAKSFKI